MKYTLLLMALILSAACGPLSKLSDNRSFTGKVDLNTENLAIISGTKWFSSNTIAELEEEDFVEGTGDYLFTEMLNGYTNQLYDVEQSNSENADISFEIKKIVVNKAHFTLNFPNPGPIYKMAMEVDIYNGAVLIEQAELRTRVNMSIINFSDKPFKWLSTNEMEDTEYQRTTFEAGLRKLYQQLYFEYFDILLTL